MFLFCLIGSFLFPLIRKLIPGQPVFLEGAPCVFPFLCFLHLFFIRKIKLDKKLSLIAFIWILMLLTYSVFSIFYNPLLPLLSLITRIGPLLMMFIAYEDTTIDLLKIRKITEFFCVIGLFMLPFFFLQVLSGPEAVPSIFKHTNGMIKNGKHIRAAWVTFPGIFNSNHILALNYLCIIFMLFCTHLKFKKVFDFLKVGIYTLSCFLLVYCTLRRGAMFGVIAGCIVYYFFIVKSRAINKFYLWICLLFIALFIFGLDQISSKAIENKCINVPSDMLSTDLVIGERVNDIFFGFFKERFNERIMGYGLGVAGPEGQFFGILDEQMWIETGATFLLVELGIGGVILFPILCFYLVTIDGCLILNKNKFPQHIYHSIILLKLLFITLFTLFYFKEIITIIGGSLSSLIFWAIPGIILKIKKQYYEQRNCTYCRNAP